MEGKQKCTGCILGEQDEEEEEEGEKGARTSQAAHFLTNYRCKTGRSFWPWLPLLPPSAAPSFPPSLHSATAAGAGEQPALQTTRVAGITLLQSAWNRRPDETKRRHSRHKAGIRFSLPPKQNPRFVFFFPHADPQCCRV